MASYTASKAEREPVRSAHVQRVERTRFLDDTKQTVIGWSEKASKVANTKEFDTFMKERGYSHATVLGAAARELTDSQEVATCVTHQEKVTFVVPPMETDDIFELGRLCTGEITNGVDHPGILGTPRSLVLILDNRTTVPTDPNAGGGLVAAC